MRSFEPSAKEPAAKLSRRGLVTAFARLAVVIAAGSTAVAGSRFLNPVLTSPLPRPVELGPPDQYPVGSLTYSPEARAYLGRDEKGFYAIIATCTHLGCTIRLEGEAFVCPCHGSRFTREGQVTQGPAPRALDRAYVGRAADGRLVVDCGRLVDPDARLPV